MHAGVGVLQVGGGVALKRKHGVPVEYIIAGAVFAQISVFDRADADGFADFRGFVRAQFRIFLFYQSGGALDGFGQQVNQFHGIAAARFERLAVFAHHGAEADKLGFCIFRQIVCFA